MVTRAEKHAAAAREVRLREKVYPRWVADGKMTKADADREIRTMREIAEDYREPGLFDDPRRDHLPAGGARS